MRVWVYVEGPSDRIALNTLWASWQSRLSSSGWGIQIIPLDDKSKFFRKIGPHAAEKMVHDDQDLVVGLPDLYPNGAYSNTKFKHDDLSELKRVQTQLVRDALQTDFNRSRDNAEATMSRFFPSALKHDLEVLLLAAVGELRQVLGTTEKLENNWRHPVEDQNQQKPPKYLVEELFRTKKGRCYRDTLHAKVVLEKVTDIKKLLYSSSRQLECPVFKETMDWIGERTGVPAY
jgi:hypothetical protein